MRPSSSLMGASRLPLTMKRGNKDYYKGSRQAYVPGAGHRTGPPGKHVVGGKAKYRLIDEQVRYFVGPGMQNIETTELKPYVTTAKTYKLRQNKVKLPSFGPQPKREDGRRPEPRDFRAFSKSYNALSEGERAALIHQARRNWFDAIAPKFTKRTETEAVAKPE